MNSLRKPAQHLARIKAPTATHCAGHHKRNPARSTRSLPHPTPPHPPPKLETKRVDPCSLAIDLGVCGFVTAHQKTTTSFSAPLAKTIHCPTRPTAPRKLQFRTVPPHPVKVPQSREHPHCRTPHPTPSHPGRELRVRSQAQSCQRRSRPAGPGRSAVPSSTCTSGTSATCP